MVKLESDVLGKLNFDLTFGEVIRVLYNVALDYCVLRSLEMEKLVCVSKEQLISLLERGYSEKKISELFDLCEKTSLKSSSLKSFRDVEKTKVLVITEDGGSILSAGMAFSHIEHEYPEWWNVPLPLAFVTKNKIVLNAQAEKMKIAKQILRVDCASMPTEQPEFFVTLQEKNKSHSVLFKFLTRKIYLIEDVTQDMETANDIVWCAAVGRALTLKLECEGKVLWKEGVAPFGEAEETLACEWDGKNVGILCIGSKK